MSQQQSRMKTWAQTQLGRVLFKVYQAKMAWSNRFGRGPKTGDIQAD